MTKRFHASLVNPFDDKGPWIDIGGNYVYRKTGWELNPALAQKQLKIRDRFLARHKKMCEMIYEQLKNIKERNKKL